MSKVKIEGNASGTGTFTITSPNSSTDRTITLPDATGDLVSADASGNASITGNLSFNSGYGSAATAYGVRAWVNFNGTGTIAIRSSGNVSSITDGGTGSYTVNFTNSMPDAEYTAVPHSDAYFRSVHTQPTNFNTTSVNFTVRRSDSSGTYVDGEISGIIVVR